MIICSCLGITDKDIERALAEVGRPAGRLPTPGIIYRRLEKRMVCCGCAPLVLSTIREKIDRLDGRNEPAAAARRSRENEPGEDELEAVRKPNGSDDHMPSALRH